MGVAGQEIHGLGSGGASNCRAICVGISVLQTHMLLDAAGFSSIPATGHQPRTNTMPQPAVPSDPCCSYIPLLQGDIQMHGFANATSTHFKRDNWQQLTSFCEKQVRSGNRDSVGPDLYALPNLHARTRLLCTLGLAHSLRDTWPQRRRPCVVHKSSGHTWKDSCGTGQYGSSVVTCPTQCIPTQC